MGVKVVNVTDFSGLAVKTYKEGKIWTEAFAKAFACGGEIRIPAGRYYIDKSLIVKSETKIIAEKGAEIILVKGVKTLLLRNERVADGSDYPVPEGFKRNENVHIEGGTWGEENTERLGYGKSGCFDEENSVKGVSACFLFCNVNNLTLKNLTFCSTAGFAVQTGEICGFNIENIQFNGCFADGLHVNGNVKNGKITNLHGHTEDDLIALNMYDWDNSSINFGGLENVVVDGIYPEGGENAHKSVRIQPGIYRYKDGSYADCYVKNLTIRNVCGITSFKMYLQTPAYTDKPEKEIGVGRIENVIFENISADTREPVDKQRNYLNSDPVTGCFATFEIGSNVNGMKLINVKTRLDKEKYPYSYLITVGPKSCYISEKGLELFDPYVRCKAEGLSYENVFINGKRQEDISPFVKEVSFDTLYPSKLPFGSGKIGDIKKIK